MNSSDLTASQLSLLLPLSHRDSAGKVWCDFFLGRKGEKKIETAWWFQTFFIFHDILGMECHHPIWRTPSFFRGIGSTWLNHQDRKRAFQDSQPCYMPHFSKPPMGVTAFQSETPSDWAWKDPKSETWGSRCTNTGSLWNFRFIFWQFNI